jgi:hypothetical protein
VLPCSKKPPNTNDEESFPNLSHPQASGECAESKPGLLVIFVIPLVRQYLAPNLLTQGNSHFNDFSARKLPGGKSSWLGTHSLKTTWMLIIGEQLRNLS